MTSDPQQHFSNELTRQIVRFLTGIGIEVVSARLVEQTFLPGISVQEGKLLVDESKLLYPGDLLHEAGHLAVVPAETRTQLSGEVVVPGFNMDLVEAQAIAWSYAASLHLGLDAKVVFHESGYRGQASGLLRNFELGVCPGAAGLEQMGMTRVGASGEGDKYPRMTKWLRD